MLEQEVAKRVVQEKLRIQSGFESELTAPADSGGRGGGAQRDAPRHDQSKTPSLSGYARRPHTDGHAQNGALGATSTDWAYADPGVEGGRGAGAGRGRTAGLTLLRLRVWMNEPTDQLSTNSVL